MGRPFIYSFNQANESVLPIIGGKAVNLVKMRRAGLPVPPGYCVTTDVHEYFLETGKLPDGLVEELVRAKNTLGGKIAIRSSANCEDGTELSMAGVFTSHYVYSDEEIAAAVEGILKQAHSEEVAQSMAIHGKTLKDIKMGLVIQELIEPEAAGVIYTGVNGNNTLVQYVDDFGAKLVDGKTPGSAILIDRNGIILQSTGFESRPLSLGIIGQISRHSQAIGNLFPGVPQDIEFASRGDTVHIVQARTLTTDLGRVDLEETPEECLKSTKRKLRQLVDKEKQELGTETAIFSDANYSELLPRPTEMDIGLYMYVWGGNDGIPGAKQIGHSKMGYQVGDDAIEIIQYIGGRTYSSIGRYAAIYHIGFPETRQEYFTTLVNEYLRAVQKDPERGSYPQMGLFLQDPTFKDLQARFGDKAEEYFQTYQRFTVRMRGFADKFLTQFRSEKYPQITDFIKETQSANIDRMSTEQLVEHSFGILEHIRTDSYVDFVKAARLGFYYSQRLQDLLRDKLAMGSDKSKAMYSRLNQGLDGSAVTEANIAIAEASSDEKALQVARTLVGHFSTGEMLEIRHQPLRDRPDALETYIKGIRQTRHYKEDFERQKDARLSAQQFLLAGIPAQERQELEGVIQSSQTYMALRETIKYLFTKEYLLLRDTLEVLGKRLGLESGDIYYVYPRELPRLAADPQSMLHLIRSRKQSFRNYQALDVPHVVRESDIKNISLKTEKQGEFTEASGKFLAEGPPVEGVIVNLDDFKSLDEAGIVIRYHQEQGIPVILAATQMGLSHDPLIAQVSGLVIESAGIVAHCAQRARELGKGAIGGIRSTDLKTGMRVAFDPEHRLIRRLN